MRRRKQKADSEVTTPLIPLMAMIVKADPVSMLGEVELKIFTKDPDALAELSAMLHKVADNITHVENGAGFL